MSALETYRFAYRFPSEADGGAAAFDAELDVDTNPVVQRVGTLAGALSAEECRRVIEMGESRPRLDGGVSNPESWRQYRLSQIAWIAPERDNRWLYERLGQIFALANADYEFELLGMLDAPQYTVYGDQQYFDWHVDVGPGPAALRKLSLSVQLTPPEEYLGGELEFPWQPGLERPGELGTAIIFPSYLAHRVAPVTSGVRRSLVAWACGPSFR